MPRSKGQKKVRLNFETSEELRKTIEDLKEKTDSDSLAEVIRRSLRLYSYLLDAANSGSKIQIKDEDGVREVIIL